MRPTPPALHPERSTPRFPGGKVEADSAPKNVVLAVAFRLYKSLLSPLLHAVSPGRCLYLPTCSEYAYTAIHRFGVVRGSLLALRRVARCHPWGKGGLDPVPERHSPTDRTAQTPSNPSGQKTADHLP